MQDHTANLQAKWQNVLEVLFIYQEFFIEFSVNLPEFNDGSLGENDPLRNLLHLFKGNSELQKKFHIALTDEQEGLVKGKFDKISKLLEENSVLAENIIKLKDHLSIHAWYEKKDPYVATESDFVNLAYQQMGREILAKSDNPYLVKLKQSGWVISETGSGFKKLARDNISEIMQFNGENFLQILSPEQRKQYDLTNQLNESHVHFRSFVIEKLKSYPLAITLFTKYCQEILSTGNYILMSQLGYCCELPKCHAEIKTVNSVASITITYSDMKLLFDKHGKSVRLPMPGVLKATWKVTTTGIELENVTGSNSLLKNIIMGEKDERIGMRLLEALTEERKNDPNYFANNYSLYLDSIANILADDYDFFANFADNFDFMFFAEAEGYVEQVKALHNDLLDALKENNITLAVYKSHFKSLGHLERLEELKKLLITCPKLMETILKYADTPLIQIWKKRQTQKIEELLQINIGMPYQFSSEELTSLQVELNQNIDNSLSCFLNDCKKHKVLIGGSLNYKSFEINEKNSNNNRFRNFLTNKLICEYRINDLVLHYNSNTLNFARNKIINAISHLFQLPKPCKNFPGVCQHSIDFDAAKGEIYITTLISSISKQHDASIYIPGSLEVTQKVTAEGIVLERVSATNHVLYRCITEPEFKVQEADVHNAVAEENLNKALVVAQKSAKNDLKLGKSHEASAGARLTYDLAHRSKAFFMHEVKQPEAIKNFVKEANVSLNKAEKSLMHDRSKAIILLNIGIAITVIGALCMLTKGIFSKSGNYLFFDNKKTSRPLTNVKEMINSMSDTRNENTVLKVK